MSTLTGYHRLLTRSPQMFVDLSPLPERGRWSDSAASGVQCTQSTDPLLADHLVIRVLTLIIISISGGLARDTLAACPWPAAGLVRAGILRFKNPASRSRPVRTPRHVMGILRFKNHA